MYALNKIREKIVSSLFGIVCFSFIIYGVSNSINVNPWNKLGDTLGACCGIGYPTNVEYGNENSGHKYISGEREFYKTNKCNSSNLQHLVGLHKNYLVNFYFPADSLILKQTEFNNNYYSRYSRLAIILNSENIVQSVVCI